MSRKDILAAIWPLEKGGPLREAIPRNRGDPRKSEYYDVLV